MQTIPNYHIVILTVLGATNTLPARVKLKSEMFQQSVIVPFTNEPGDSAPSLDTAVRWLNELAFEIVGKAEGNECYYLILDTFAPLKK